ncbi:MAG: hypothetical protein QUV35_15300 [Hydrogenophaga sp.]|uniref:hypothetical protein n=1 Tax=Hydrogenophaga sp. TaxID=1904254 RepID=UPI0026078389|nr:hypothetical protein [Hydrogenophaga sp.]MDM7943989.1 hypothetical protein [Hydrogenophaga sp.]
MKKIKALVVILTAVITLHAYARSPNSCRAILDSSYNSDQWNQCLLEPEDAKRVEDPAIAAAPGYTHGVIVGKDTLESIQQRRPDILPFVCEDNPLAKELTIKNDCSNAAYFRREKISIETQGGTIEVSAEEASHQDIKLSVYRTNSDEGAIELWFSNGKLITLLPLGFDGTSFLPNDVNGGLLMQSLSSKYKKAKDWVTTNKNGRVKANVWAMSPTTSVELIEHVAVYKNRAEVLGLQSLYKAGMKLGISSFATKYHDLEILLLENRFPKSVVEKRQIRYIDNRLLSKLVKNLKDNAAKSKQIERQEKNERELGKVQRY